MVLILGAVDSSVAEHWPSLHSGLGLLCSLGERSRAVVYKRLEEEEGADGEELGDQ